VKCFPVSWYSARVNEPEPLAPTLKQVMDAALVPFFGDNLEAYYAEIERNDTEVRELQDRARRCAQELINGALDRLMFFGGDRLTLLPEAERNTQAQRAELDRELHEALVGARERFNQRVKALRVIPVDKDEESAEEKSPDIENRG
jgi:hypothetical protein